jgi:ribonucleotide monophosphatase NagD (HAD superfamily)
VRPNIARNKILLRRNTSQNTQRTTKLPLKSKANIRSMSAPLIMMLNKEPVALGKPSQAMMDSIEGKFKFSMESIIAWLGLPSATGSLFNIIISGALMEPAPGMMLNKEPVALGKPSQAMMDSIEGKFKFDRSRACICQVRQAPYSTSLSAARSWSQRQGTESPSSEGWSREGKFKFDRSRACMVGDRANTDIRFGLEGKLGGTLSGALMEPAPGNRVPEFGRVESMFVARKTAPRLM